MRKKLTKFLKRCKKCYSLDEITVKSQAELDRIPNDYEGQIFIGFGTEQKRAIIQKKYQKSVIVKKYYYATALNNALVIATDNSNVIAKDNSRIQAFLNSFVSAYETSEVVATGHAFILAKGKSSVTANESVSVIVGENASAIVMGNVSVRAYDSSLVTANDKSSIECYNNSLITAWGDSIVMAYDNSFIIGHENASITVRNNASAIIRNNSSAIARENSSVIAEDCSSVLARDSSSIKGHGDSFIKAFDNCTVMADANTQVINRLSDGQIQTTDNARIVHMPQNIDEYCNFFGIQHSEKKGKFFKAVHKINGRYFSDYDSNFEYVIQQKAVADDFDETDDYGSGIHITHETLCLEYGKTWNDLAILEVETDLKSILMSNECPGILRCPQVTVLREVPLEKCGIFGQFLYKRMNPAVEINAKQN